ncbi:helix-turn-helix transcriptional regulator [Actinocorallia longicatena]
MVHLAGLSLRESTDPSGFIGAFSGTNRQVVDYLGEEVVAGLSGEVVEFITRISILDRFSSSLCDEVAGTDRSTQLIAELEQSNLFVVRLDDNRCWYRFHNLFRDFLSDLLDRTEPGARAVLHKRASRWHAENGFVEQAIEHALSGQDLDTAVDLIARHWHTLSVVDRAADLRGWLKRIGDERMDDSAIAAICAARVAALSGDRNSMHHWLGIAAETGHDGPLPDGTRSVRSASHLLRSEFGFDGLRDLLESAKTAVGLETTSSSPWFAQARLALGYGRLLSGSPDYAIPPLEEAAQSNAVTPCVRIAALAALSLAKDALDRTQQSLSLARAARAEVESYGLRDAPEVSLAYTAMGVAAARIGRAEEARQELEHALRIRWRVLGLSPWPTLTALLAMARFELASNDPDAARKAIEQARELLRTLPGHQDHLWSELAEVEDRLNVGTSGQHQVADPLTDREVAVLRLLAGDLSLREIGGRLYVSVNTVKSHSRAIYRKLGVTSRIEAVERAGELGLIQSRVLPPHG